MTRRSSSACPCVPVPLPRMKRVAPPTLNGLRLAAHPRIIGAPSHNLAAVRGWPLPCLRAVTSTSGNTPRVPPGSCLRRRAATARASIEPCRRSSTRSISTASRSTSARRSSTTSTWSRSWRRGGDIRRGGDRGSGGRDGRLLRPRRRPERARERRGARPEDDRRHLPAGHQGARRGSQVRSGRLHDRPDRPRGPRGGRGDDRARRPRTSSWSRPRPTSTSWRSRIPTGSPTSPRPRSRSMRPARSSPG